MTRFLTGGGAAESRGIAISMLGSEIAKRKERPALRGPAARVGTVIASGPPFDYAPGRAGLHRAVVNRGMRYCSGRCAPAGCTVTVVTARTGIPPVAPETGMAGMMTATGFIGALNNSVRRHGTVIHQRRTQQARAPSRTPPRDGGTRPYYGYRPGWQLT